MICEIDLVALLYYVLFMYFTHIRSVCYLYKLWGRNAYSAWIIFYRKELHTLFNH